MDHDHNQEIINNECDHDDTHEHSIKKDQLQWKMSDQKLQ